MKTLGWMKHKMASRLLGEISITSDADDTTLMAESEEELKSLLVKVKEESENIGFFSLKKTKIMASGLITSWQRDGKTVETVRNFIFRDSKITADGDCSHEIKRHLLLGRKVMNKLVQFSSVAQSCPIICDPMNCSTPGCPIHCQLQESTQTHVHWVGDAIQPSHALSSPSPPALNLSQHQGLLKWVSSSHQVAKVLEIQLQHHSFQWTPRTHLL